MKQSCQFQQRILAKILCSRLFVNLWASCNLIISRDYVVVLNELPNYRCLVPGNVVINIDIVLSEKRIKFSSFAEFVRARGRGLMSPTGGKPWRLRSGQAKKPS